MGSTQGWLALLRRISYYVAGILVSALCLLVLNFTNDYLIAHVAYFPFWLIPLVVAAIGFVVGNSVLQQARESDKLKYEFITVATHKLRTPLTRIRWIIPELLSKVGDNQDVREGIRRIDDANNRLIELTNVLMETSHPGGTYDYQQVSVDLRHLAWEAVKRFGPQISEKKLAVTVQADRAPNALGDARRLGLVTEVLVENAVIYTPANGQVSITVMPDRHGVRFAVTDTGIGVAPGDRDNIFSSFYRTTAAREADTEGVGLGLSLAKRIIERQGGRIGVESQGVGKGSTFWFTMPEAKVKA